jgi:hypothetical protein
MKLISPSIRYLQPVSVEVGGYTPNWFGRLMGQKPIAGKLVELPHVAGRAQLEDATIDFENTPFIPYDRYHEAVAFGNHLYEGIFPYQHHNDNVWRCRVENVRLIRVEPAYVEAPELR